MDINFPNPPQGAYTQTSYTSDGRTMQADVLPPSMPVTSSLGANFSHLVGSEVYAKPNNPLQNVVTPDPTPRKPRKKKASTEESEDSKDLPATQKSSAVSSKDIVENTVYADNYIDTNNMTYGIIAQSDALLRSCKEDLDYMRSQRSMKGKYHYINATITSMSSLLSTKLAAIKEINSNIKTAADQEYRRFKDTKSAETVDDNKVIMDAYKAFISAPIGAPVYQQPGTMNLTGGLNGVIRADYPDDVQAGMDKNFQGYMANLSDSEKIMMAESNPNMKEYIEYDEATGSKRFVWYDETTGQPVPGMPAESSITLDDYVIDPNTKTARNVNINDMKSIKIVNSGIVNRF